MGAQPSLLMTRNLKLRFDGQNYEYIERIGYGVTSILLLFQQNETKAELAVKFMTTKLHPRKRNEFQIACLQCGIRSVLLHDGHVEVMEKMDGNLVQYLQNTPVLTTEMIAEILQGVRYQLTHINHGVYTDIKCTNVLFKIHPSLRLKVHVGEIDSIQHKNANIQHPSLLFQPLTGQNDLLVDYLVMKLYTDIKNTHALHHPTTLSASLLQKNVTACLDTKTWDTIRTQFQQTTKYNVLFVPGINKCNVKKRYSHYITKNRSSCPIQSHPYQNFVYYNLSRNTLKIIKHIQRTLHVQFRHGVIMTSP